MKIIVSCHCDTVFRSDVAYMRYKGGILRGALDNFASMLAASLLISNVPDAEVEFTEDEENSMDGARQLARANNNKDTMFIVMDVTADGRGKEFTIENVHRVRIKEVHEALKELKGKYKVVSRGTESEAWLYKDMGFATIEVDIPARGGLHSLDCATDFYRLKTAARAIELIIGYFKDKPVIDVEEPT